MFPHKQDSHFQAVPVLEKRKKAQKGPWVETLPQRGKHPAEQPILCQRLQLPHSVEPMATLQQPPALEPCAKLLW